MSALGSDDDCYFYFYSSCTKGDDCPFRHCQAALGTEIVCSLWREGRCIRDNCKFRHMESRINRGTIPCYWEDQPSGCLKPHCVFFHRKLRPNVLTKVGANEGLILPVSSTTPQTSPLTKVTEAKDTTLKNIPVESYSSNADDSDACPASVPIEPIVFSFDNEESDSESASSTPMKSTSNDSKSNSISPRKNLLNDFSEKKDDFGIKTLEQLKMEKIHKESDNFYKLDYDAPLLDPLQIKMKSDNFKAEIYPPKAEFISIPSRPIETEFISIPQRPIETEFKSKLRRPIETEFISKPRRPAESEFVSKLQIPIEVEFTPKPIESEFISVPHKKIENPISATIDSKDQSFENERNSRNRLMKRKNIHAYPEKSIPPKKMISLKKTDEDDTLDFKIKTLEEIRKEKMNKIGKEKIPVKPTSQNIETKSDDIREPIILNNKRTPDINGKTFKKLKLKRQSNETLLNVNDVLQEADSSTDGLKKERNQMILHEVQNISEDQSKADAKTFICKRKEVSSNSTDEKSPKQLKVNHSTSPKNIEVVGESEEKQVRNSHLIIKRKISTSLLSEQSVSPPKELLTVTNVYDSIIPEQTQKIAKEENHCSPKEGDSHKYISDNEKSTVKTSSVDDIDSFLLNEANVTLDYEPDGSVNESDDILLEIEQLLDS